MISLIPCYSIEDFSLYRKASDVDEIFSAWSALYHPALIAHFDDAPRWEAAGSPSSGQKRRLVVVPPCAEYLLSNKWIKDAEAEGAVVIRHVADRDDILKEAFERLGVDPLPPGAADSEESLFAAKDAAETFLTAGLGCLLEELLTRKLRYMSNLDQISFNSRLVEGARAYMKNDVEEREKALQKAFDLLTQSKEYFFPTATKFLELTWVEAEDLEANLPQMLRERRARKETSNLVLPVPVLKQCQRERPETLNLLREEIAAQRVLVAGGDEWEAPLYLMSPTEIADQLAAGRRRYLDALGIAPTVFARHEAGYAQILPQLLVKSGYKGALSRTGDGWNLLQKHTDRSQIRWQGRDGSTIPTICKNPLNAADSEEILQMPERIGNSYYSDSASAVVFEYRPGKASRWLRDLRRMDQYSPVLGKFYDLSEYLRITEGSGDKEKFVKDAFKTNFLTRSAKRSRKDLVSLWTLRRKLGVGSAALRTLESTIRAETFKVKSDDEILETAKGGFEATANLTRRIQETIRAIDAYLFPVDTPTDADALPDFFAEAESSEREKDELLQRYAQFLNAAIDRDSKRDQSAAAKLGDLLVNASSTPQTIYWELTPKEGGRDEADADFSAKVAAYVADLRSRAEALPDLGIRAFVDQRDAIARISLVAPPTSLFWTPKSDDFAARRLDQPFFAPLPAPLPTQTQSLRESGKPKKDATNAPRKKESLFSKFVGAFKDPIETAAVADAANKSGGNAKTLVDYVERRFSATEIERFYRLRNDFFEIRVDPTTGATRRLETTTTTARFTNGALHQPTLGNRFAWDIAMKLTRELRKDDGRPETDSGYGYSVMAADEFEILSASAGVGALKIAGRLIAPNGDLVANFFEIITIRSRSRIIDVEVEIDPRAPLDAEPWNSYYGCRFAWKDALAEIRGGVGAALIGTAREYIQAPEAVDIRSEEGVGVTILSRGIPYYRKTADARLDAILVPTGETRRRFRFAIGIDLEDPHGVALEYADSPAMIIPDVKEPRRAATQFLTVRDFGVRVLEAEPIVEEYANARANGRAPRINDDFLGARVKVLETHSAKRTATIKTRLEIERVEELDLLDETIEKDLPLKNSTSFEFDLKPRQLRIFKIVFKRP